MAARSHVPKAEFALRHKVILFGEVYRGESAREEEKYRFIHRRIDAHVTEGWIPVGFLSSVPIEQNEHVFLATRRGEIPDEHNITMPEFQLSWRKEREVLGGGDGWSANLDELWTSALSYFEDKSLLMDETLDYLDADPFVLFGIDDPTTQRALQRLEHIPALISEAATPGIDEWRYYLRVDPDETELDWVLDAFASTELPPPWTCYKGVGSIVCFVKNSDWQVTWKHPFYDYFKQLVHFCRNSTTDEVLRVKVNRMLWTYESTRDETEHDHRPLISPEYVFQIAKIFGYKISEKPYIVRTLKAHLKIFAAMYRESQEVTVDSVKACREGLAKDVTKFAAMQGTWQQELDDSVEFELNALAAGDIRCVECDTVALSLCLECKDYLCLDCFAKLHKRGTRKNHGLFRLIRCSMCVSMPARIHCTFTDRSFCHECYAMKHVMTLPPQGRENPARKIEYKQQYDRQAAAASLNEELAAASSPKGQAKSQASKIPDGTDDLPYDTVLGADWHPFYDARGVQFYHNFATGERMPYRMGEQPGNQEPTLDIAALESFKTVPKLPKSARNLGNPQEDSPREVRPPHRVHIPCQVPYQ